MANVLKEKLGPLPLWAWLGIITIAGLLWYLYSLHKGTAAAAAPAQTGQTTVPESSVPDFVIQNQYPPSPAPGPPPPPAPAQGAPKVPAGFSEVDVTQALADRKAGADIWVLGADEGLHKWDGKSPAPGLRQVLLVSTEWMTKHNHRRRPPAKNKMAQP